MTDNEFDFIFLFIIDDFWQGSSHGLLVWVCCWIEGGKEDLIENRMDMPGWGNLELVGKQSHLFLY
jgi:hypothetical protein